MHTTAMERVLTKWLHGTLSHALNTWMENHAEIVRAAAVMDKVVARWTHMTLWRALDKWEENHNYSVRMGMIKEKVLNRWLHKTVWSAFNMWCENHQVTVDRLQQILHFIPRTAAQDRMARNLDLPRSFSFSILISFPFCFHARLTRNAGRHCPRP